VALSFGIDAFGEEEMRGAQGIMFEQPLICWPGDAKAECVTTKRRRVFPLS
jgi:hypothetical protein